MEIYIFGEFHIRHFLDAHGKRWFHLKDACDALGIKNPRDWTSKVTVERIYAQNSRGQRRQTNFVLANDLYSRIIPTSRVPGAEKFKNWMGRVMNSVMETGKYDINDGTRALQIKRLELELFKEQTSFIREFLREFPDDRLRQCLLDDVQNFLTKNKNKTTSLLTLEEINRKNKIFSTTEWLKVRSTVGKRIAQHMRDRHTYTPPKTNKLVNGTPVEVNMYDVEYHNEILDIMRAFQSRGKTNCRRFF